uniref:Uncharacterized protein n=1 Tax=Ditylenchus dipsaci TaxID=166011 RepID=A0A915E7Q7_9BILA
MQNIFDRYFTYLFKDREISDNALINFFSLGDSVFATTETPHVTQIDVNTLEAVNKENLNKYIAIHNCTAHQQQMKRKHYQQISDSSKKLERALYWSPLKINLVKLLAMKAFRVSYQDSMSWYDNSPTRVHVFNWKTGEPVKLNYVADPQFTFHHANSFEVDGKYLVLDYCKYDRMDLTKLELESMRKGVDRQEQSEPYLHRMIIPLMTGDCGTEICLKISPLLWSATAQLQQQTKTEKRLN